MSKDIIVLTPNGRRQKVQCKLDTSILEVLENVCNKQGFQSNDYDLKYHNHILDLTTTLRFSNIPNKATLEMVEAERKWEESNVTIALLLEDGERRTADFPPTTSLYDIVISLAATELTMLQHPTILYMRQEITGVSALKEKSLRQLGLIKGKAILRLLNKVESGKQANVSTVYRSRPSDAKLTKEQNIAETKPKQVIEDTSDLGPSDTKPTVDNSNFDPITLIRNEKLAQNLNFKQKEETIEEEVCDEKAINTTIAEKENTVTPSTSITQVNLERRLQIEEEVTFVGTQKAIVFMQPDTQEDEIEDLPDEFYELTIEEVRKLYNDLQQHRLQLENTPLITSVQREVTDKQTFQQKLNTYKNVVVRIQFPDHIILQGVFSPSDTIGDVVNFIKDHLEYPDKEFQIFTTPLKETLDLNMTLLDAKFVPCVHMHFKWLEEDTRQGYLKKEIYEKRTTSDAASILASKYRAPSRRKLEEPDNFRTSSASTSKNSKMPKWFKN